MELVLGHACLLGLGFCVEACRGELSFAVVPRLFMLHVCRCLYVWIRPEFPDFVLNLGSVGNVGATLGKLRSGARGKELFG